MKESIPNLRPARLRALMPHLEELIKEIGLDIDDKLVAGVEHVSTDEDVFEELIDYYDWWNDVGDSKKLRPYLNLDEDFKNWIRIARRKLREDK